MATTTIDALTSEVTRIIDDCAHGEGTECIALEQEVICYAQALQRLRSIHEDWMRAIHSGVAELDQNEEEELKALIQRVLEKSVPVIERGAQKNEVCFGCSGFGMLAIHFLHFHSLLENWVTPRRAVGPAARVKLSPKQQNIFFARLANLGKGNNDAASRID